MNRAYWLSMLGILSLLATVPEAWGQARNTAYIAYVYPAGGQQGSTFQIRLGGQRLNGLYDVLVSGSGITAKLIDYHRQLGNQEFTLLREQLKELRAPSPQNVDEVPQQDQATLDLIEKIEQRLAQHVNTPACISHADLAFVEVTIAPDAEPGAGNQAGHSARCHQPAWFPRRPGSRSRQEADENLRRPGTRQGAARPT